jgi:hypothetical protein
MKLNQHALNQGAAAGALVVVMKLIAYLLGITAYMSTTVASGSLVFVIAGMCIACIAERKREGGLTFRDAFRTAWVAAAVSTLLVLVFELLLFGVVDPELAGNIAEITMAKMETDLSGLMELPKELQEETRASIAWWSGGVGKIVGSLFSLLFWGVIAAIVGATLKRDTANTIR